MSPRGRTCLVSRLPELRRDGGARAGAPAPPAPARPRARGSRCGPGRGRREGSGRGASSTGGTGGGSAMPSSHRPDRSAASADTRPALCRAPLTTSPLADRPGGPPRPRLVGDGADAPSAPARARSGRGAGYRTQGAAPADRRGQQVRVRDPRDRQRLGDGSRRLSRRTATGCQLIVMIADRTTLSIARNRAATWSAMLAMMGLPPGCAAAIAPRTVLVTTPNADNQRGGCVRQSDVA